MVGTKHIDLALCIYIGAYLICIDNKYLKDLGPRENGTLCKVIGAKFKHNPQSYKWEKSWEESMDSICK
jgi:hypothetical protein